MVRIEKLNRSNKQALSEIANGQKSLAKTSEKNNEMVLKKKENEKKDIFHFEEKKWEEIGIMSSVFLIYLAMHHNHNSHVVFNFMSFSTWSSNKQSHLVSS